MAHLNALRREVDEADDALKQSRLDALLVVTSGDLTALGDGRKSSSGKGREATIEANRTDDATAIVPMDLETGAVHGKRPSSPPTAPTEEEARRLPVASAVLVISCHRWRRAVDSMLTHQSDWRISTNF